jgi:hypothetical protein
MGRDPNNLKLTDGLRTLPAPLRIGALVDFAAFVLTFISLSVLPMQGVAGLDFIPWALGSLGLSSLAFGMILATDFQGSASAYARLSKTFGPVSGSRFLVRFVRAFGVTSVVFGACFVAAAVMIALVPTT